MVSEFITLKPKTNERVKVQMAVGCLSRQRSVECIQVQKGGTSLRHQNRWQGGGKEKINHR